MNRPCPAPLPIPLEHVGDSLPFAQVLEAAFLDRGRIEEERDTARGWSHEAEPTRRQKLRDNALRHVGPSRSAKEFLPSLVILAELVDPRAHGPTIAETRRVVQILLRTAALATPVLSEEP